LFNIGHGIKILALTEDEMKRLAPIKHPDGSLILMRHVLRQRHVGGDREVMRIDLAKMFRLRPDSHGRRELDIRGRYLEATWYRCQKQQWTAYYIGDILSIGCVVFTKAQSAKIRRWALAK
jgi:hypothetical protein